MRLMVCLQVQHRMRPEISRLIRWRYPTLQDHASTHGRPHIQGMVADVMFLDHTQPEVPHEDAVAMGNQSKINEYEVEMAVRLADHLLHQEVMSGKSITILTPYLGQLAHIRRALTERNMCACLNERDAGDLSKLDLLDSRGDDSGKAAARNQSLVVHAATVDNYQGIVLRSHVTEPLFLTLMRP
jgi:hypothetical protein